MNRPGAEEANLSETLESVKSDGDSLEFRLNFSSPV